MPADNAVCFIQDLQLTERKMVYLRIEVQPLDTSYTGNINTDVKRNIWTVRISIQRIKNSLNLLINKLLTYD